MLKSLIKKIADNKNLSEKQAYDAVNVIMKGEASVVQVGAFLVALRMKGETIEEITGCAKAMRDNSVPINIDSEYVIDTCGTGGDGGRTFNISTAVSIIAAAAGIKVAKHGNRAVSSSCGAADVLEALGFNINIGPEEAKRFINEKGMTFLFAQKYHVAMKNVGPIRKELGIRTVFNILGPLTNPAFVRGQVLGVYDKDLTHTLGEVLLNLGCERAMVVHGEDGLDEITTTGKTYVSEIKDNKVIDYEINPRIYGIALATEEDIKGYTAKENAKIILKILNGEKGPQRDIVVFNSAAALYVGKVAENLGEGIKLSEKVIDSGKAYEKLKELIECNKEA